MKALYYLQLFIHQIATEPDCRNAGIIEDIAVNRILVDVLGKQQADDVIAVSYTHLVRPPRIRALSFHLIPTSFTPTVPNSYGTLICIAI